VVLSLAIAFINFDVLYMHLQMLLFYDKKKGRQYGVGNPGRRGDPASDTKCSDGATADDDATTGSNATADDGAAHYRAANENLTNYNRRTKQISSFPNFPWKLSSLLKTIKWKEAFKLKRS